MPYNNTLILWISIRFCSNSCSFCLIKNTVNEPPRDKTNKVSVRPAKTQISLDIHPVWSESLLGAQWVAKDRSFLHSDSKDSDQTGRMPRLIWVFAGRTVILLVLTWGGSNVLKIWTPFLFLQNAYTCSCSPRTDVVKVVPEVLYKAMIDSLRQQFYPRMRQVGRDRKISDSHRNGYSWPMCEKMWCCSDTFCRENNVFG